MSPAEGKTVVVGVTGASGAVLAQAALRLLEADAGVGRIHLVVSETGARDAMVVIPCSMGTLATIAAGTSDDLIARAADVCLKEGRRLVLCVRDTPFSRIHLENMLRAQQAGAVIMPAIVSFYHQPKTIDDLVAQYVYRVLAQMGLPQEQMYRWEGQAKSKAREV